MAAASLVRGWTREVGAGKALGGVALGAGVQGVGVAAEKRRGALAARRTER
jgi:hypothetical protein